MHLMQMQAFFDHDVIKSVSDLHIEVDPDKEAYNK